MNGATEVFAVVALRQDPGALLAFIEQFLEDKSTGCLRVTLLHGAGDDVAMFRCDA